MTESPDETIIHELDARYESARRQLRRLWHERNAAERERDEANRRNQQTKASNSYNYALRLQAEAERDAARAALAEWVCGDCGYEIALEPDEDEAVGACGTCAPARAVLHGQAAP